MRAEIFIQYTTERIERQILFPGDWDLAVFHIDTVGMGEYHTMQEMQE